MTDQAIYHICRREEWASAQAAGSYAGSSQDRTDGFVHFSAADQVVTSAAKHRAGQSDLILVAVDVAALASAPGPVLRWEASRGGALFPHLYGQLPMSAVRWTKPLPLGADGRHVFPPLDGA